MNSSTLAAIHAAAHGNQPATDTDNPATPTAAGGDAAAWAAEYNASPALQAEFEPAGGLSCFLAFKKGEAEHLARLRRQLPGLNAHAIREKAKLKFDADPQIRADFGTLSAYQSYAEGVMSGRIRVARKDLKAEFSD